jgi:hypothetical protein
VPSSAVRQQPVTANCDGLQGPERSTCFSARAGSLYVIRGRTVEQVQAFYLDQLPRYGWILDTKHMVLRDGSPGMEHTRSIVACSKNGDFVSANFGPESDGIELALVSSFDDTEPCPSA